jgi:hypothetical protein
MRLLFRRDTEDSNANGQILLNAAFTTSGQVLATSANGAMTVTLSNSQPGAAQTGSYSMNVTTGPVAVSSGQSLVLLDPIADFQCFSVTDSHGEKVMVVTRPLRQSDGDERSANSPHLQDFDGDGGLDLLVAADHANTPPARELLLIDSAGRIFARRRCPGSGLVGKLAEPHGRADQLVFGKRTLVSDPNGLSSICVVGTGVVCIVEGGELKAVRSIPASAPPTKQSQSETELGTP